MSPSRFQRPHARAICSKVKSPLIAMRTALSRSTSRGSLACRLSFPVPQSAQVFQVKIVLPNLPITISRPVFLLSAVLCKSKKDAIHL
jgi:hypothetical protein